MTKPTIAAFKAFGADWTCRGFKYEVGQSYEHVGKIVLCEDGEEDEPPIKKKGTRTKSIEAQALNRALWMERRLGPRLVRIYQTHEERRATHEKWEAAKELAELFAERAE